VVGIGSHEPAGRETDDALARRATVVVESRGAALREAGDVVLAIAAGTLEPDELVTLAELACGEAERDPGQAPPVFKSVGMAWEDAVVASALIARR
jgi:ornithine cyclodeaminase/alanine dehydrogenase-like protein (mu-crystallin family)